MSLQGYLTFCQLPSTEQEIKQPLWRRRFFVLNDHFLSFFYNDNERTVQEKALGYLDLTGCKVVLGTDGRLHFDLLPRADEKSLPTVRLCASSVEERDTWFGVLSRAIKAADRLHITQDVQATTTMDVTQETQQSSTADTNSHFQTTSANDRLLDQLSRIVQETLHVKLDFGNGMSHEAAESVQDSQFKKRLKHLYLDVLKNGRTMLEDQQLLNQQVNSISEDEQDALMSLLNQRPDQVKKFFNYDSDIVKALPVSFLEARRARLAEENKLASNREAVLSVRRNVTTSAVLKAIDEIETRFVHYLVSPEAIMQVCRTLPSWQEQEDLLQILFDESGTWHMSKRLGLDNVAMLLRRKRQGLQTSINPAVTDQVVTSARDDEDISPDLSPARTEPTFDLRESAPSPINNLNLARTPTAQQPLHRIDQANTTRFGQRAGSRSTLNRDPFDTELQNEISSYISSRRSSMSSPRRYDPAPPESIQPDAGFFHKINNKMKELVAKDLNQNNGRNGSDSVPVDTNSVLDQLDTEKIAMIFHRITNEPEQYQHDLTAVESQLQSPAERRMLISLLRTFRPPSFDQWASPKPEAGSVRSIPEPTLESIPIPSIPVTATTPISSSLLGSHNGSHTRSCDDVTASVTFEGSPVATVASPVTSTIQPPRVASVFDSILNRPLSPGDTPTIPFSSSTQLSSQAVAGSSTSEQRPVALQAGNSAPEVTRAEFHGKASQVADDLITFDFLD
eukprot:GILK01005297.1.p1 GENE.GILK01005297.1~~GILK01005297.1.p1  ORF type:complete len:736 (-),score=164.55 GILK01005297.1:61-2268(-)